MFIKIFQNTNLFDLSSGQLHDDPYHAGTRILIRVIRVQCLRDVVRRNNSSRAKHLQARQIRRDDLRQQAVHGGQLSAWPRGTIRLSKPFRRLVAHRRAILSLPELRFDLRLLLALPELRVQGRFIRSATRDQWSAQSLRSSLPCSLWSSRQRCECDDPEERRQRVFSPLADIRFPGSQCFQYDPEKWK